MAALTTALLAMSAGNTVSQFIEQRRAAKQVQAQGDFEGNLFDTNAALADSQASDVLSRGRYAAGQVERGARQLQGAQRAAYGAAGLDVSTGSPAAVQANDRALSAADELQIRNNAAREAWGYRTEGANYRAQGAWARMAGRNQAGAIRRQSIGTLLQGAGELANIYSSAPKGVGRAPSYGPKPPPVPWENF